jgi:hypothetical protein
MPVYTIYADSGSAYSEPLPRFLDGNEDKIRPAGYDWIHPEGREYLSRPHPAGGWGVKPNFVPQGVPMETVFLPTKIQWFGRKRQLHDVLKALRGFIVSEKFRKVIEGFEPGIHQFVPVNIVWKDGERAGDYYWFFCCNRLDSMDREKTTMKFDTELGVWDYLPDGVYVVSQSKLGNHVIWHDSRVHGSATWITEPLKQALDASKVTGIGYRVQPCV